MTLESDVYEKKWNKICCKDEYKDMHKGPHARFSEHTLVNTLRERILLECAKIKFKKVKVKYPHPVK